MRLRLHTTLVVSCLVSGCSPDAEPLAGSRIEVVQAPSEVLPGTPTAQVLIVRVLDDMGQSTEGVPVRWEAAAGSGSLQQSADTSGVDGLASALWTPGLSLEEQQISVTTYDRPALRIRVRAAAVLHADKISSSYPKACGLMGSAVWCWDIGPSATTRRVLPQVQATDVAVSSGYVCVLDSAGTTYCQVNFGTVPPEEYVSVPGLPPIRGISAGGPYFCGIAIADATPWCWMHSTLTPVQVSSSLQLSAVSAGSTPACGLTAAGEAWCWDGFGGNPVAVAGGHSFRSISTGRGGICAVAAPTRLYCWDGIDGTPVSIAGVSATQVAMGSLDDNLVNTSSGATMFYLSSSGTGAFYLEQSSALPIPARQVSDHCVVAFDGSVYCTPRYNPGNPAMPFTWAAIPAPTP